MSEKSIIRLSTNPEGYGETPDELSADMFASALPTQHSYEYYSDEDLGLYVGVWDTDTMVEAAGQYFCDEFMWLIEGECEIKNCKTGAMEKVTAGQAFVIPKGYECQWHQTGYLRKFFVIYDNPQDEIPTQPSLEGVAIPEADASLSAMSTEAPFAVSGGAAAQEHICYQDTTGKFISGTWASETFEAQPQAFPYNEFAYVQAGAISLFDEQGQEQVFTAGDAFFIPQGVVCSAQASASVKLFFAIVKSA